MYSSKSSNSKYMEFVGYETCENFIWTSGEVSRDKDETIKQGSYKTHINNISPPSSLIFGCFNHKDTCDILSEDLVYKYFKHIILKSVNFIEIYKEV